MANNKIAIYEVVTNLKNIFLSKKSAIFKIIKNFIAKVDFFIYLYRPAPLD